MMTAQPVLSTRPVRFQPTWTGITLGAGFTWGEYVRFGRWVEFWALAQLGAGFTFPGGSLSMNLPITAAFAPNPAFIEVGYLDSGTATYIGGVVTPLTTQIGNLCWIAANVTYGQYGIVTSTTPMTWASGDQIEVQGHYLGVEA